MTIIARFQAENYKRLKAVEIVPGEGASFIPILGKNAQGKSSVLDAIMAALGGKSYMPSRPVRKGEEEGAIRLELSNGLVVRRIFAEDGTGSIVVENAEGARYPSPQTVLDKLYSSVAFDPIAFIRLPAKEQLEQLRRLVKLEVDVDELGRLNKEDYDARRELNREAKQWEGQLTGFADVGEPAEPIDTAEIERAIGEAAAANGEIEQRKVRREQAQQRVQEHLATAERWGEEIARLEAQLAEAREAKDVAETSAKTLQEQIDKADPLPEPVDVSALTAKLSEAQTHNRRQERAKEKAALVKRIEALHEKSAALTTTMEAREKQKAEAFAKAEMPVPGLSFGEGEVLFNDLPLDQASTAEQLRISTAIGMAAAPELRVMLVRDASLLDDEGFALLAKMATDGAFQFWVESVDTSGKVGIVMEDGAVKGAPEPEPIDKGRRRAKSAEAEESASGGEPETAVGPADGQGEEEAVAAEPSPAPDKQPWVQPEVEQIDPATLPEEARQDLGLTPDAGAPAARTPEPAQSLFD
jgi:hypothetical protein